MKTKDETIAEIVACYGIRDRKIDAIEACAIIKANANGLDARTNADDLRRIADLMADEFLDARVGRGDG